MTNQPILGIVPSFDDGESAVWQDGVKRLFLRRDYFATLSNVGATPVILSPDMDIQQVVELCDGIIISGGADIDPSRYGQKKNRASSHHGACRAIRLGGAAHTRLR